MSSSLSLFLLLLFAAPPEQDYEQAITNLDAASENFAAEDRKGSIKALEDGIDLASRYPDEAPEDNTVPASMLRARVVLVRLYIAEGDDEAARETMDELIRTAGDQTPPVQSYGPEVSQLYQDRKTALDAQGLATIELDCKVACDIVINERRVSEQRKELMPGAYRVWVKASEGEHDWEYHEVALDSAGAVQTIVYEDPTPPAPPPPAPPPPPPEPKRMLPRAAEIAGLAVGVGLLVTGAVLLSFDGKCSKTNARPTDMSTQDECGDLLETTVSGFSLVGVGGGLLVVSGVMLSIDEVRVGRAKGRQVMLGVSMRF